MKSSHYINLPVVYITLFLIKVFSSSATAQLEPVQGTLKGSVIYPSDVTRAQQVCAVNVQSNLLTCVETKENQRNFSITVTPGTYVVYSRACRKIYGSAKLCSHGYLKNRAYYNEYIRCGITAECKNKVKKNLPIPVKVESRQIIDGIKPQDWYTN
jgi:hypothetical protein